MATPTASPTRLDKDPSDGPSTPIDDLHKFCPFCGEEILAVAKKCKHCGEFLQESGMATSSTHSRSGGEEAEQDLWAGKPHWLNYLAQWILGIVFLPVFGLGFVIIIYAILDQNSRKYKLTTKRATTTFGVLTKRTNEVLIRDIKSLHVTQTFGERLFGLGTVQVASAGHAGIEVDFVGIAGANDVYKIVQKAQQECH